MAGTIATRKPPHRILTEAKATRQL